MFGANVQSIEPNSETAYMNVKKTANLTTIYVAGAFKGDKTSLLNT